MQPNQPSQQDRRQFSRVVLDWPVEIVYQQKQWPALLIDLSFRGALLNCEHLQVEANTLVHVHIHIPQSQKDLQLEAKVVRHSGSIYALQIDSLDIESMSELRRMIELNIGNDDLLQRELEQLLAVR